MSSLQCLNAQLLSLMSQDTSLIYSLKYRVWGWKYKTMGFWAFVVSTVCSSLPGPFVRPTFVCVPLPLLWPSRGPSGAWKIWSCHPSIVLELGEVWSPKFYRSGSWGTVCSSQAWRDVEENFGTEISESRNDHSVLFIWLLSGQVKYYFEGRGDTWFYLNLCFEFVRDS